MAPPESPATESGVEGGGTLGCWGGRASRDSTASNCCRVSGAAEAAARAARTGHTLDLSGGETSGITTLLSTAPIVTSRSVAFEVLSPIWTFCSSSFSITTLSLILPAASSMSDVASSAWTTAALRLRRLARTGRESPTHVVVARSGVLLRGRADLSSETARVGTRGSRQPPHTHCRCSTPIQVRSSAVTPAHSLVAWKLVKHLLHMSLAAVSIAQPGAVKSGNS